MLLECSVQLKLSEIKSIFLFIVNSFSSNNKWSGRSRVNRYFPSLNPSALNCPIPFLMDTGYIVSLILTFIVSLISLENLRSINALSTKVEMLMFADMFSITLIVLLAFALKNSSSPLKLMTISWLPISKSRLSMTFP